ncbi:MAG: tellurite resistance TerB C-terminal domain-containing protein [Cyclobacteriaceae bacterium]
MTDINFHQKYNVITIPIDQVKSKSTSNQKEKRFPNKEKKKDKISPIQKPSATSSDEMAINIDLDKILSHTLSEQGKSQTEIPISQEQEDDFLDETIIDVNNEDFDLTIESLEDLKDENETTPPYWSHSYVYSYDELEYATKKQKKFYYYFKSKVANGEYVDIQGNTNYAFVLYFDFLNEYKSHRDIKLLEGQFKLIGEICPKTKNYSLPSLLDELRKRKDNYSINRLKDVEDPTYQYENGYSDYNPDLYKLGNQYKKKLGLTKIETRWLNKFYNPNNVFNSIEGCCKTIIHLYLLVLNEINTKSAIDKTLNELFEKVIEIQKLKFSSNYKEEEKSWAFNSFQEALFLTFFKSVENVVREKYGHKRKLSFGEYYPYSQSTGVINDLIGNDFYSLLEEKLNEIDTPDKETQIELNAQNVNRWKAEFNQLKTEDKKTFIKGIEHLEETNQKNPNIEHIFFEASKFIAKQDNIQALKYYAFYIYYDLKSKRIDNKELPKTIQKSLFKTEEQVNDFKSTLANLIESKDIDKALEEISTIYLPKRKQIKLDRTEIKKVEKKHDGTVELLSGYLETDNDSEEENALSREEEITIVTPQTYDSIFKSEISLNKVQEELLEKIVNSSFEILQSEVDQYATQNNLFKNQLIDSINDACEELLEGEALIEEDDENYVIEESYYNEILK